MVPRFHELARTILAEDLPMGPKFLAVTLALYANADGNAWPSHARLSRDLGATEKSVRNWQRDLERRGLLITKSGGGRRQTNTYRLVLKVVKTDNRNPERGSAFIDRNPERGSRKPGTSYQEKILKKKSGKVIDSSSERIADGPEAFRVLCQAVEECSASDTEGVKQLVGEQIWRVAQKLRGGIQAIDDCRQDDLQRLQQQFEKLWGGR